MGKIENDHQLQVSRNAIKRLQRALKGYEEFFSKDDSGCLESLRIGIRQIEREIEAYLAEKAAETSSEKTTSIRAASG